MQSSRLEFFFDEHFTARHRELDWRAKILGDAVSYSLHSGGKRFRPQLAFLTAELLGVDVDRVLPHAAAVELVHSYSLIHDDLPCMDNDTFRRGQWTSHVAFGEATALLAGDALLTEAFYVLGVNYKQLPELGLELTRLLAEAAGLSGMIAGQVSDLNMASANGQNDSDKRAPSAEEILKMHAQKTGALIRYSAEGVAVLARLKPAERQRIREFGEKLGLAFQVADDLLDYIPENAEKNGLPYVIGVDKTRALLAILSQDCRKLINGFGARAAGLNSLIEKNLKRTS